MSSGISNIVPPRGGATGSVDQSGQTGTFTSPAGNLPVTRCSSNRLHFPDPARPLASHSESSQQPEPRSLLGRVVKSPITKGAAVGTLLGVAGGTAIGLKGGIGIGAALGTLAFPGVGTVVGAVVGGFVGLGVGVAAVLVGKAAVLVGKKVKSLLSGQSDAQLATQAQQSPPGVRDGILSSAPESSITGELNHEGDQLSYGIDRPPAFSPAGTPARDVHAIAARSARPDIDDSREDPDANHLLLPGDGGIQWGSDDEPPLRQQLMKPKPQQPTKPKEAETSKWEIHHYLSYPGEEFPPDQMENPKAINTTEQERFTREQAEKLKAINIPPETAYEFLENDFIYDEILVAWENEITIKDAEPYQNKEWNEIADIVKLVNAPMSAEEADPYKGWGFGVDDTLALFGAPNRISADEANHYRRLKFEVDQSIQLKNNNLSAEDAEKLGGLTSTVGQLLERKKSGRSPEEAGPPKYAGFSVEDTQTLTDGQVSAAAALPYMGEFDAVETVTLYNKGITADVALKYIDEGFLADDAVKLWEASILPDEANDYETLKFDVDESVKLKKAGKSAKELERFADWNFTAEQLLKM